VGGDVDPLSTEKQIGSDPAMIFGIRSTMMTHARSMRRAIIIITIIILIMQQQRMNSSTNNGDKRETECTRQKQTLMQVA